MAGKPHGVRPARIDPELNQQRPPARFEHAPEFVQELNGAVVEDRFIGIRGVQVQAEFLDEVQTLLVFGSRALAGLQLFPGQVGPGVISARFSLSMTRSTLDFGQGQLFRVRVQDFGVPPGFAG